jgi:hypothetical protein
VKTQKQSLRKIVRILNNHDEDGGFWLPHIQRAFVWSEEQIGRLLIRFCVSTRSARY